MKFSSEKSFNFWTRQTVWLPVSSLCIHQRPLPRNQIFFGKIVQFLDSTNSLATGVILVDPLETFASESNLRKVVENSIFSRPKANFEIFFEEIFFGKIVQFLDSTNSLATGVILVDPLETFASESP